MVPVTVPVSVVKSFAAALVIFSVPVDSIVWGYSPPSEDLIPSVPFWPIVIFDAPPS